MSTPMALRPQRAEASRVVPVPMKGSSTVSPANENIRTSRYASSSGNGAGWRLVDSPLGPFHTWRNHVWCTSFVSLDASRCQSVG
jgi:hypothetical protein